MIQTIQKIPKGKKFFQHKKKYKGVPMKQADGAAQVFKEFFDKEKFDLVIEVGSGTGGFTLILAETLGKKLHTFDITNKMDHYSNVKETLIKMGVNIYVENVFESDTIKKLIDINKGRTLILCDNGDKKRELELFSSYLKSKDVIMVHDYFPTPEDYYNQDIWKCCAFTDDDENDPTLENYYRDEFTRVFWMSRIKI